MNKISEKLVRVTTSRLPNEQHFMFHTENRSLYAKYGIDTLGIGEFMPGYDADLADEDVALEVVLKSAETSRIVKADAVFDRTFMGLSGHAKTCLKHYDPAVCHAAENLSVVFGHYGNITKQPYRQKIGSSVNLLQELRARATDFAACGLAPWADAHEQAASALAKLFSERTVTVSQQSPLRMHDVRASLDGKHQKIINRIDAKINLSGKDFAGGFYAEYNAHATEYKNKLAQHLGRIKKGGAKAAEGESVSNAE